MLFCATTSSHYRPPPLPPHTNTPSTFHLNGRGSGWVGRWTMRVGGWVEVEGVRIRDGGGNYIVVKEIKALLKGR